jgi:hypothetical protein
LGQKYKRMIMSQECRIITGLLWAMGLEGRQPGQHEKTIPLLSPLSFKCGTMDKHPHPSISASEGVDLSWEKKHTSAYTPLQIYLMASCLGLHTSSGRTHMRYPRPEQWSEQRKTHTNMKTLDWNKNVYHTAKKSQYILSKCFIIRHEGWQTTIGSADKS